MTMLFTEKGFRPGTSNWCPACYRALNLALVEPHPTRNGMEIQTFNCENCGPVKARIVALPSGGKPPQELRMQACSEGA